MAYPIIQLVRKLVTGGTLSPVPFVFAQDISSDSPCSVSSTGELVVPQGVSSVTIKALFPSGTTGTAYLACKKDQSPSTTNPADMSTWVIVGAGVAIASNIANITLAINDLGGMSKSVGMCVFTFGTGGGVVAGSTQVTA